MVDVAEYDVAVAESGKGEGVRSGDIDGAGGGVVAAGRPHTGRPLFVLVVAVHDHCANEGHSRFG